MLKARNKLEPWRKPRPPGYRKREGQRLPIIFVRYDNYEFDLERKVLRLRYWNVEIPFKGELRWLTKPGAKQGRLIIHYDPVKRRWYARVSVEVPLQPSSMPGLKAGVDLGREILAAVAVEDGHALLYRGGPLKSDYFYFSRRGSPRSIGCYLIPSRRESTGPFCERRGGASTTRGGGGESRYSLI